jgi:hypothetical protein
LGCLSEICGYAGRIIMWRNPWDFSGFMLQIGMSPSDRDSNPSTYQSIVCITIAPVFMTAAIYIQLYKRYAGRA